MRGWRDGARGTETSWIDGQARRLSRTKGPLCNDCATPAGVHDYNTIVNRGPNSHWATTMTDEERQRIYEEEKARADARLRIEQENKAAAEALEVEKKAAAEALAAKNKKGCGIGCLGILLLIFLLSMLSGPAKHTDEYGLDTRDPDYKTLRRFADGK